MLDASSAHFDHIGVTNNFVSGQKYLSAFRSAYMKRAAMLVKKLWRETGETIPLQSKDPIGALNSYAARYNEKRFTRPLRNNIVLYDQFAVWLVELATLLIFTPRRKGEARRASYQFLVGAIASLTLSIRHQVVLGQDVGAKILVRSLCEYIDVLMLLITRPELAKEFEQEDFRKANEFWHRHVKSLKASKAVWNSLAAGSENTKWRIEWDDWIKQEDTVLSIAAHPSYVAAAMSVIPLHSSDSKNAKLWPAYFGGVTESSIRTLTYTIYRLGLLAAFTRFPFGEREAFKPLVIYDEKKDIHRLIEAGKHVLLGILFFLSSEGRDNPHYHSAGPPWLASS
jgi:hypothetical protein